MRNFLLISAALAACAVPERSLAPDTDPKEPVFWSMCYDALGAPVDYDGECDGAQEINWGKLPVMLHVDPAYPDDGRAVLQAVRVWNAWLGTDVFEVTQNPVGADIYVVQAVDTPFNPAGIANHVMGPKHRPVFLVTLFGDYANNTVIVVHELGHTLGLAHDPGRSRSVMHPSGSWYVPWITRKDCAALRHKYHLKQEPCN